jgi:hypothetical protein
MNNLELHPWQNLIASDLNAVLSLIEFGQPSSFRFAQPLIREALMQQELASSSLLLLCARAMGAKNERRPTLHAFAAGMELITLSLHAHANLPDTAASTHPMPLLSLGTATGVLLSDYLYTRAFGMIVRTGHPEAVAEVAKATERMVTAATAERFSTADSGNQPVTASRSPLAAAWGASCSLAALLAGATHPDASLLRDFGVRCGMLKQLAARSGRVGSLPQEDDVARRRTMSDLSDNCLASLVQAFPASGYREDLASFVAHAAVAL